MVISDSSPYCCIIWIYPFGGEGLISYKLDTENRVMKYGFIRHICRYFQPTWQWSYTNNVHKSKSYSLCSLLKTKRPMFFLLNFWYFQTRSFKLNSQISRICRKSVISFLRNKKTHNFATSRLKKSYTLACFQYQAFENTNIFLKINNLAEGGLHLSYLRNRKNVTNKKLS